MSRYVTTNSSCIINYAYYDIITTSTYSCNDERLNTAFVVELLDSSDRTVATLSGDEKDKFFKEKRLNVA